jgi:hypothetical protein
MLIAESLVPEAFKYSRLEIKKELWRAKKMA